LSEGQRCLICLYAILHFLLAKGSVVILDKPENFVSLREIQPWLTAVSDTIEEGEGQMLLISHHPELMNQWAPSYGLARIVVLGEDIRHQSFVRRYLYQLDYKTHDMRFESLPGGRGCGEQWVRQRYANAVGSYREISARNVCGTRTRR
jgi:ATPase subunit of ABC transporter with duplicated ATPase domains